MRRHLAQHRVGRRRPRRQRSTSQSMNSMSRRRIVLKIRAFLHTSHATRRAATCERAIMPPKVRYLQSRGAHEL